MERTLSIIKPNAVKKGLIGPIYQRFTAAGFEIVGAKMVRLSKEMAQDFYKEHQERPFFESLVSFMTSGPVMVQVLQSEEAVLRHRDLMGATNPENATTGTLRFDYGESLEWNSVHGSDSLTSAQREISFFFSSEELSPE